MIRFAFATPLLIAAMPVLAETRTISPGEGAQERLQEALILAQPGDEIVLEAGRYAMTDGLSLDVAGVTMRGAGMDGTVLDFTGQQGAGEGMLVTADDVTLRDFALENPKGDGVKSKGADDIVYHRIRVTWTRGPHPENGAYGIYPVESVGVLVDGVKVTGASDAGIYVGQSDRITVRNSIAEANVAGIEIENSRNARVEYNVATRNTGGILIFDLPNLPVMGGGNVVVANNLVVANDTANFAPPGNIVASVRRGTGIMVMANENVLVENNILSNNPTAPIMVIAYPQPYEDPRYSPIPRNVVVGANLIDDGGTDPQIANAEALLAAFGGELPPLMWDGIGDPGTTLLVAPGIDGWTLGLTEAGKGLDEANPAPLQAPHPDDIFPQEGIGAPPELEARLSGMIRHAIFGAALACAAAAMAMPRSGTDAAVMQDAMPRLLSEYGFFADAAAQAPNERVTPYRLNTPLYSDGADKLRFVYLPAGQRLAAQGEGLIDFPVGSALIKTFAIGEGEHRRLLETRVLLHRADGWVALPYVWNAEQTDAVLAVAGTRIPVTTPAGEAISYRVPNKNQCKECHGLADAVVPIGPKARNLSAEWLQANSASCPRGPIRCRCGKRERELPAEVTARAYLDVNCAHCHRPGATASNSGLDLRWEQADPHALGVMKRPVAAGRGAGGHLFDIVPGEPDQSILLYRMLSTDPGVAMPELGKETVDREGTEAVRRWIAEMKR